MDQLPWLSRVRKTLLLGFLLTLKNARYKIFCRNDGKIRIIHSTKLQWKSLSLTKFSSEQSFRRLVWFKSLNCFQKFYGSPEDVGWLFGGGNFIPLPKIVRVRLINIPAKNVRQGKPFQSKSHYPVSFIVIRSMKN